MGRAGVQAGISLPSPERYQGEEGLLGGGGGGSGVGREPDLARRTRLF